MKSPPKTSLQDVGLVHESNAKIDFVIQFLLWFSTNTMFYLIMFIWRRPALLGRLAFSFLWRDPASQLNSLSKFILFSFIREEGQPSFAGSRYWLPEISRRKAGHFPYKRTYKHTTKFVLASIFLDNFSFYKFCLFMCRLWNENLYANIGFWVLWENKCSYAVWLG